MAASELRFSRSRPLGTRRSRPTFTEWPPHHVYDTRLAHLVDRRYLLVGYPPPVTPPRQREAPPFRHACAERDGCMWVGHGTMYSPSYRRPHARFICTVLCSTACRAVWRTRAPLMHPEPQHKPDVRAEWARVDRTLCDSQPRTGDLTHTCDGAVKR